MQYKVPQNVDIEDRVIAGMTLKQFMYLMIAGGVILILRYIFVGPISFLFLPIALLIGCAGAAFAFIKINDRPFEVFIVSAAKTLMNPKKRVWTKDTDIDAPKTTAAPKPAETQKKKSLGELRSSLEKLATIVDSGGAHEANLTEERLTNVKPHEADDTTHINDFLAQTEEQKPTELTRILNEAKDYVTKTKKEATVGELATVNAKKEDFKYDSIELADEEKLVTMLNNAQDKQKALDEKLDEAKIEKFEEDRLS